MHEFFSFRSNGGILVHGPSKVPLRYTSCCNCTTVDCGLQVGTNSGTIDTDDKESKEMTAEAGKDTREVKWEMADKSLK